MARYQMAVNKALFVQLSDSLANHRERVVDDLLAGTVIDRQRIGQG